MIIWNIWFCFGDVATLVNYICFVKHMSKDVSMFLIDHTNRVRFLERSSPGFIVFLGIGTMEGICL